MNSNTKRNKTLLYMAGVMFLLISPLLLIALILLEAILFRTHHISDLAESLGLAPFLRKVFTAIGIDE